MYIVQCRIVTYCTHVNYTKEQMRLYIKEYRQKRRDEAIELLGGMCVQCSSEENLEFDHKDPNNKSFNISGFWYAKKNISEELKKCQLLCKSCHDIKTGVEQEDRALQTRKSCGSVAEYKRGCRCVDCVAVYGAARQRWNLTYRGRK